MEKALSSFTEIQGKLKQSVLSQLAPYAKDEDKKNELLKLSKKDGLPEFEKLTKVQTNVVDIIEKYELKVPLGAFF